jgi:NTE family protein
MDAASATFPQENVLEEFALFRTLSAEQRLIIFSAMTRQDLVRGGLLVEQGASSDALFLVLNGALAVYRNDHVEPIAELRAGELVGEIGFFANIPRTANVIAIRDSSVLALTRSAYEGIAQQAPAIVEALLAALARRFGRETARLKPLPASPKARTVAFISGGFAQAPPAFEQRLRDCLAAIDAEIVDLPRLNECFPGERWTHPKSPIG